VHEKKEAVLETEAATLKTEVNRIPGTPSTIQASILTNCI